MKNIGKISVLLLIAMVLGAFIKVGFDMVFGDGIISLFLLILVAHGFVSAVKKMKILE